MLGRLVTDTLVADDETAQAEEIMAQLSEGRSWSGEFTVKRQDGTPFPVAVTNTPIFDDDGELTAIIGISNDITERKRAEEALQRNLDAMVETIASTVEHRDPYTAGHQWRVAELAGAIGRELGLDEFTIEGIEIAAKIHDLGKISVPSEILTKPTNLTAPELELIKQHAEIGYQIIEGIDFPWPVAEMVRQHHERLDGSGYPRALLGEEILLGARIIAVADTVEAMDAHRPYRPSRGLDAALKQIEQDRGTRLDADAVDACLRLFRSGRYWLELPDVDVAQGRLALQ
jgi:HD-GYP domain-containing protein (c-di-GMP phosphodiesterase class II)